MRVGSLFSGIGGLDLGLERAGMEVVWQVEIDEFCRRVLAKHWPHVERYGDIREVDPAALEPVDLICGGFPCQPVSTAGKRLGQSDQRWLWPEFGRILRVLRPRYVLVENVPGLLVRGMGDVLGELASLGYDTEWTCLTACSVGAPHMRNRVFIVAHPSRAGLEGDLTLARRQGTVDPSRHGAGTGRPWAVEPRPLGVADGVSDRVDRIGSLGNAVVPQVAEYIGRLILEADAAVTCRY